MTSVFPGAEDLSEQASNRSIEVQPLTFQCPRWRHGQGDGIDRQP
jgi:hypothetical protein